MKNKDIKDMLHMCLSLNGLLSDNIDTLRTLSGSLYIMISDLSVKINESNIEESNFE